jgi:hypothetical protein
MKTKATVLCILAFTVFTLIISCNETSLNDSGTQNISYISHKSNGCVSENSLLKTEDDAVLNIEYDNGNLNVEAMFTSLCALTFKDSVLFSGNRIEIFLNAEGEGAYCLCPYKEEFNFKVSDASKLCIFFNYKLNDQKDYNILADSTIVL